MSLTVRPRIAPLTLLVGTVLLAGCAGEPPRPSPPATRVPPPVTAPVADAVPRAEPRSRFGNPAFYEVAGRRYVVLPGAAGYLERGVASWYGPDFHGKRTASGENYDMYAMTAAHPTLPIPSYVRVTHLGNGRSVVVRVNDRGPFLHERVIDLSYAAAWKLGYVGGGSALVEVESVLPGETLAAAGRPAQPKEAVLQDTMADPIAAITARPAEPPPALPTVQELRGVFLQLGAFGNTENAEAFRTRLQRQLSWLAETIHIHSAGGMYRLHLGPYRDAQEAGRVAEKIQEALAFRPFVVQR